MYTLRTVFNNGIQAHTNLENSYVTVFKETSPDEFIRSALIYYGLDENCDNPTLEDEIKNIFGFVNGEGGTPLIPLFIGNGYFIMVNNGRTFEKLSR